MKKKLLKNITSLLLAASLLLPAAGQTVYAAEEHIRGIDGDHVHDECCHEEAVLTETTYLALKRYDASTVKAPTASYESGTIYCASDSASIKLSAGSGATIYYSLNDGKYKKYSSQIKLTKSSTVKAYAKKDGKKSKTATFKYTLTPSANAIKFKTTETEDGTVVKMTSDIGKVKLYYTTDGSTPTTKSKAYTSSGIKLTKTRKISVLVKKSGWEKTTITKTITVGSSSGNSGGSSASAKYITKGKETRECKACVSGVCNTCYGLGTEYVLYIGNVACSTCGGTGKCSVCGGTSKVTVEVNVINENAVPAGKEFEKCWICKGSGVCGECNGTKIWYGGACTQCGDHGECRFCDGRGGELVDKPASSSGNSSSGNSSSSSSSSSSSFGNNAPISAEFSKFISKGTETRDCGACNTGNCVDCYGSGLYLGRTCQKCSGTGKCTVCKGTHKITAKVNVVDENAVPEGKEFKKCGLCKGSGVCYYCNGTKVWFGKKCSTCSETGICSYCGGSGGELKDKPAPSTESSSSGSSSSGNIGSLNLCFSCGGTGNCNICHGGGLCQVCFGRGGMSVPTYGQGGSGWVTCKGCNGSRRCKYCSNGRCSTCGGSGKRY